MSENVQIYNSIKRYCDLGSQLFSDSDFSDVTLVCGDNQHLPAHRAVLCASSSFLRQLLYDSQHQRTFLYLGSVPHEDLRSLLELIYLGSCSLKWDRMEAVLALASGLGVPGVPEVLTGVLEEILGGEEGKDAETNDKEQLKEENADFYDTQLDSLLL